MRTGRAKRIVPDSEKTPATDLSEPRTVSAQLPIFVELWITSATPPVAALRKDLPCFWRACWPIAHAPRQRCSVNAVYREKRRSVYRRRRREHRRTVQAVVEVRQRV